MDLNILNTSKYPIECYFIDKSLLYLNDENPYIYIYKILITNYDLLHNNVTCINVTNKFSLRLSLEEIEIHVFTKDEFEKQIKDYDLKESDLVNIEKGEMIKVKCEVETINVDLDRFMKHELLLEKRNIKRKLRRLEKEYSNMWEDIPEYSDLIKRLIKIDEELKEV